MTNVQIETICIDGSGQLHISTEKEYPYIWRAAMGVNWDSARFSLVCPHPKEWTYLEWFQNAYAAVRFECGDCLIVTASTQWVNIPDSLRNEIIESNKTIEIKLETLLKEQQSLAMAKNTKDRYRVLTHEADIAFKNGTYDEVVRILSTSQLPLSRSDEKKLEYSRKKLKSQG